LEGNTGASDQVVPFGDFLVEGLGLLAVMLQRVAAQGEVHRWLRRAGEAHYGGSQFHRIARLMVADLGGNFAHGPGGLRVVFDGLFRAQERGTGEEVGAELTGFNRGRKDAERRELLGQGFRNAFDSELCGAVKSPNPPSR
jgi:hypothetical protein